WVTSAKTFSRRGLIIDLNLGISLIVLLWEGKGEKEEMNVTGFLESVGKETGFLAASLFLHKDLRKKPGFSVAGMG
ncbi:MAG: hypothetical protein ACRCU2_07110, partial [Planktothrix sp.]